MTRNPQPTQGTPTSRWRSIRTVMTLPLLSHWYVVLALALFVYVFGLVLARYPRCRRRALQFLQSANLRSRLPGWRCRTSDSPL